MIEILIRKIPTTERQEVCRPLKSGNEGILLMVRAFIQARMSSSRFPGKMLAPFNGRPIIANVISQVAQVIPKDLITVATSTEESDDPLVYYVTGIGISVYRGPLHDVFERFQGCLRKFPCEWFFRVCGDSPLLDVESLKTLLRYASRRDIDLVTNVQVRTFPIGHSAEMLNSSTFAGIDLGRLSPKEKEHVTKVFYNNPEEFRIVNIESDDPGMARISYAVDTLEDLIRLERSLPGYGCCEAKVCSNNG